MIASSSSTESVFRLILSVLAISTKYYPNIVVHLLVFILLIFGGLMIYELLVRPDHHQFVVVAHTFDL